MPQIGFWVGSNKLTWLNLFFFFLIKKIFEHVFLICYKVSLFIICFFVYIDKFDHKFFIGRKLNFQSFNLSGVNYHFLRDYMLYIK